VNATSAFREDSAPTTLFMASDFHFTARGHALYAEVLASYLVRQALVSSSVR
jgi:hypothetical protein